MIWACINAIAIGGVSGLLLIAPFILVFIGLMRLLTWIADKQQDRRVRREREEHARRWGIKTPVDR